eukprot:15271975-Ditylum_brightwellii.AAC.1
MALLQLHLMPLLRQKQKQQTVGPCAMPRNDLNGVLCDKKTTGSASGHTKVACVDLSRHIYSKIKAKK